ncbi:MAG: hypothetical protein ACOC5L_00050 [Halobacteriota archaeon]
MRVILDIPPDIEEPLVKKCQKTNKEPEELIELLLKKYFLKRKRSRSEGSSGSGFLKVANYCARERISHCKYSDGTSCTRESNKQVKDELPSSIAPYICLFCPHFVDQRETEGAEESKNEKEIITDRSQEIAEIAAQIVLEQYGAKIDFSSTDPDGTEEAESEVEGEEGNGQADEEGKNEELITKDMVEKLLQDW